LIHFAGERENNFLIKQGMGFWVQVQQNSVWNGDINHVNYPPFEPVDPTPVNGQELTSEAINLSVPVYDPNNDDLNVSFYWGNGTLIGTAENVNSGDIASVSIGELDKDVCYEWYCIANDSKLETTSDLWNFTIIERNVPDLINITTIRFGFGRLTSVISNNGEMTLENIDWNISIIGGFGNNIKVFKEGCIDSLELHAFTLIQTDRNSLRMKFGFVNITVTATISILGSDPVIETVSSNGFVLGRIIFVF
jgi:hypothetical protein